MRKTLTAIQFCLADEVLDEFSTEKTTSLLWERLQDHYLKKSLTNWLILKQCLFLLCMHEGTPIKSHIAEFFLLSMIQIRQRLRQKMRIKHFYYCVLYLLHIALEDPVIRFATPPQSIRSWGRPTLKITTIGIKAYRLFTNNWYQSQVLKNVCIQVRYSEVR